jgi:hypothetical protein
MGHVTCIGKVNVKSSLCSNLSPRYEGVLGSKIIVARILDFGT